ncbi:MAG: hypothetical protein SGPRY_006436, partial [Prymnesium sp.]
MEACLHSLLASLQRERTESGVSLVLRLLLCVRVRPTHLSRLPLAREVRRLSRQDASTRSVRELAIACEERWRDLTKLGPAGEEQRVHRSGKRGRSCRQLYASLSAVSHDDELVDALEELLYNKAASSHGRSAEKLERYIELVDSSCSALACSPLLQALLATRCLSLEALAAPPLPDAEEWLCRALRGHASEEGGPVTRGTLAANSRPTPQLQRQLLEDIARKRRRRTAEEEQPVPNPVQTALPPLPCGASALRTARVVPPLRGVQRVGRLCKGRVPMGGCLPAAMAGGHSNAFRQAHVAPGSFLEALLTLITAILVAPASPFFSGTQLDSFPPISTPAHPLSPHRTLSSNAHAAYRERHLRTSRKVIKTLRCAARSAETHVLERYLGWGFPVDSPLGGSTMLLISLRAGHWEMAEMLLRRYSASTAVYEKATGDGPLHVVAQAGAHEMIPTLMLYGALAAIDTRNNFRHSALHNAVHGRHVQATRALLEFGANPCLRFDGISVLDLAAETGHQGLMRLLSAACAKWADERGWEDESDDEDDEVQGEDEDAERNEDSADVEPSVDES